MRNTLITTTGALLMICIFFPASAQKGGRVFTSADALFTKHIFAFKAEQSFNTVESHTAVGLRYDIEYSRERGGLGGFGGLNLKTNFLHPLYEGILFGPNLGIIYNVGRHNAIFFEFDYNYGVIEFEKNVPDTYYDYGLGGGYRLRFLYTMIDIYSRYDLSYYNDKKKTIYLGFRFSYKKRLKL